LLVQFGVAEMTSILVSLENKRLVAAALGQFT